MEYHATAKYIRVSPRKVRLIADSVRVLPLSRAVIVLSHAKQHAARPLWTAITSALASAKARKADEGKLRLKAVEVMDGPSLKRWRAVSRGQAHAYKKRMTHIRVTLTDEERSTA